jgi:hypothetical protein
MRSAVVASMNIVEASIHVRSGHTTADISSSVISSALGVNVSAACGS